MQNRIPRLIPFASLTLTLLISAVAFGQENQTNNSAQIKIKNFGQMDDRFYRGAQPKESDYAALAALGIHTVVDLREDAKDYERSAVEAAGMRYVNIPIEDKHDPSDAQIAEFLKVVDDQATGKFYVHCAGGRHRTGVMGAIYRFNNYHWSLDQVYQEMLDFDFYTSNGHGGQKTFVENYAKRFQTPAAATTIATHK